MACHNRPFLFSVPVRLGLLRMGLCICLATLAASDNALAGPGFPIFGPEAARAHRTRYAMPKTTPYTPGATWYSRDASPQAAAAVAQQPPVGQHTTSGYLEVPTTSDAITSAPVEMTSPPAPVRHSMVQQGQFQNFAAASNRSQMASETAGVQPHTLARTDDATVSDPHASPSMTTHGTPVKSSARQPGPGYPSAMPQGSQLELARQLERQGDVEGADAQYRALLSVHPRDRNLLISYARMKHRANDLATSVQLYQRALQAFPNDPVILNDLGLCFARMGDLPNAVATMRAAIGLRPESQRYRNNLAIVFLEMDRLADAEAVLAEVHGDLVAKYNLGVMLNRRGKTEEAKRLLSEVVQANPAFGPARSLLAQLDAPIAQVASLPEPSASGRAADNAVSNESGPPLSLIQPQSAEIDPAAGHQAAPAVFLDTAEPPEVDAYPIPGVGLKRSE